MSKIALANGGSFEIIQDSDPQSPRDPDCNFGTMQCFHRNYILGDPNNYKKDDFDGWQAFKTQLEADNEIVVILPLFLFDHSGITMRTSSEQFRACDSVGYDWGQVGWTFATKQNLIDNYAVDAETLALIEAGNIPAEMLQKVKELLVGEVATYTMYLEGDIWGYEVRESPCGECGGEGEVVQACWGFYGDDPTENGMLEHLSDELEAEILAALKPHTK